MNTNDVGQLRKFASGLNSLHEAMKAATHCLSKLSDEANADLVEYQTRAHLDEYGKQLDWLRDRVFAATCVPKELLEPDAARKEKERIFTTMLSESGLLTWVEKLESAVDNLRPENDLLSFKKQIEDLLSDPIIRSIRTRVWAAEGSGERNRSTAEADNNR